MDEKTLHKLANEYIGLEFENIAILLGYKQAQIDALHNLYPRQSTTRCKRMLREWQRVAKEQGENPIVWLGNVFIEIGKRNDARWFCEDIKAAEKYNPKGSTDVAVQKICFDQEQPPCQDSASQVGCSLQVQTEGDFNSLKHAESHKFRKQSDDTMVAAEVEMLAKCQRSVGGVQLIKGLEQRLVGTCFVVGSGLLMTAAHVFKEAVIRETGGRFYLVNVSVIFDENSPSIAASQLLFRDADMDYAIFSLSSRLDIEPHIPLASGEIFVHPDILICLIGYGHPNHPHKCIDTRCKQVSVTQKDHAKDWSRWFLRNRFPDSYNNYTGYEDADKPYNVLFNAYLEKGASGSPAVVTDSHGKIWTAGMYIGCVPQFYYHLGEQFPWENVPKEFRFEYAVKTFDIYKHLSQTDPHLCEKIFQ